jgi:hypothetical protein
MLVEGRTEALSQPLDQCSLPMDIIEGPVYMYITNKNQQLPLNILHQDASTIEAGPAVVFIHGTSTPFNQVLMPDLDVGDEDTTPSARTFTYNAGTPNAGVVGTQPL